MSEQLALSLTTRMALRDPRVVRMLWRLKTPLSATSRISDEEGYSQSLACLASMVLEGNSFLPSYFPRLEAGKAWSIMQRCLQDIAKRPSSI